jgi:hypothetical protein
MMRTYQHISKTSLHLVPPPEDAGGHIFKVNDKVTGAPGSGREGMRGYVVAEPDEDGYYYVQWYPLDSDVELRREEELVPEGYGGPRAANILDPIHDELDQTVYQDITPRKTVQEFIKRIYYRALDKELHVEGEKWADLYLTGSLTTYQYSPTSDADVSVFPNYDLLWKELGLDPDTARKHLIQLSIEHIDGTFLPGTTHPLQFFVVPHGTMPGDLYKPGLRSAFDLHDGLWFQKPEKDRVHDIAVEYPDLFKRAEDIGDKLTQMLDAGEDDAARELWHQIHKKRQLDQQAGLGDFCEGNIVYKYLLNEGLFDRIRSELGEYIAKTATSPPYSTVFHAAPRRKRQLIEQHGIDSSRIETDWRNDPEYADAPHGNYVWDDPQTAFSWGQDVWEIPTDEYDWKPDPYASGAWYTEQPIAPHHIRRVELGEYIAAVEQYDTEPDEGHVDSRIPWIYIPETDRLVIGSPGSSHRMMMKHTPDADQGTEWYGAYGETSNRITIFSQYDFDDFNPEDIDKDLIRNLRAAWPTATIWYNDIDGDRVQYTAAIKWSMPPANMAPQFLQQFQDAEVTGPTGMDNLNSVVGYDWKVNPDALAKLRDMPWQVPPLYVLLIRPETTPWKQLYGMHKTRSNRRGSEIYLHPLQSIEKANETLWHEIQHAYQEIEGRTNFENYNWENPSNPSQYDEHPMETDARQFAEIMKGEPLVLPNEIKLDPKWVPNELHLDRGDWNEKDELWELSQFDLSQELAAQVQMYRTDHEQWVSMWMTPDEYDDYYYSKTADLWEDRVTQKVIYDFDKDTITLGTQATQAEHPDSKIIGEYKDGEVTLFGVEKQWISPQYFHRLWAFSYPEKELKDVYYRRDEGRIKLRTVRRQTNVPKFYGGDSVVMKAYGETGTIMGEPHFKDGEWWYWVHAFDSQGPKGDALYPESDMERPSRYDKPGEMTLKDMFGIPTEGEDYFRNANDS